jgi:hypothetical protein
MLLAVALACSEAPEPSSSPAQELAGDRPGVLDAEGERRMEELLALGYVQGIAPAAQETGVTTHLPGAWPGYNLTVSAHGPEAELLDMDGRVLHRWRRAFREVWPARTTRNWFRGDRYWRRVHLFPNGDLLAIFDGLGLVKLDRHSNVLWSYAGLAHHDLDVSDDGRIFVLTRRRTRNAGDGRHEAWEDFVTLLDPGGRKLGEVSLYRAVADSKFSDWLRDARKEGDIFHTNTLEIVDARLRLPEVRPGQVLVSLHGLHALAVVDLEAGRVVWGLRGSWRFQHQPTVLDNGHILLFDNLGTHGRSRVIEIDPARGEEVWRYQADESGRFFSFCCGSNERLPNGDTLVTESERGRAFEVDRDGQVVWEYWNPHRVEVDGELKTATLYEVVRLPLDLPVGWAQGEGP